MKVEEIANRGKQIASEIQKAGFPAKSYTKPRYFERESFFLTVNQARAGKPDTLYFWPGLADVKVYPNKKAKQAVLVITEAERQIKRSYRIWGSSSWGEHTSDEAKRLSAIENFPVIVDDSATFEVEFTEPKENAAWADWEAEVTATIPETEIAFLVGYDEHALFVCQLPEIARSVKKAHEVLRPDDVPGDAPRQGEWFFVPASKEEVLLIEEAMTKRSFWDGVLHPVEVRDLGRFSNDHNAPVIEPVERKPGEGPTQYAIGVVFDTRTRPNHKPLYLNGWHRVVRNNEVISDTGRGSGRRVVWD